MGPSINNGIVGTTRAGRSGPTGRPRGPDGFRARHGDGDSASRLLSFSSVSVRAATCTGAAGKWIRLLSLLAGRTLEVLDGEGQSHLPSAREHGIYGGLDGRLRVVPLAGKGGAGRSQPPSARPSPLLWRSAMAGSISAARMDTCISWSRMQGGTAGPGPPIVEDPQPLTGRRADAKYDWFTNYGTRPTRTQTIRV